MVRRLLLPLLLACLVALARAQAPEQEVRFSCGEDTLYGSLLLPQGAKTPCPAAVLMSGSGPTDRDGNTPLAPGHIDSMKHFAEVLAGAGVASLRYDKIFSGKTGAGTHAGNVSQIGLDTYLDEAQAAYKTLASRPEVDPKRMLLLGHSEGGLIALVMANRVKPEGLRGLILAAPLSMPYLDTIRVQLKGQLDQAVAAGAATQQQADALLAEMDRLQQQILKDGTEPPIDQISPPLRTIFQPHNVHFLNTAGAYVPGDLAASLGPSMPVLVMDGKQDVQVTPSMVQALVSGFQKSSNQQARVVFLPGVDHVFRFVGDTPNSNALADYVDHSKPFSPEADQAIRDFVKATVGAP